MIKIREFDYTNGDYADAVAIFNVLWPEIEETADEWKFWDETRDKKYLHERLMGEVDGEIVATASYGECSWAHVPGKYHFDIMVHPEHQRRGHGTAIFDHILSNLGGRDPKPEILTSWTREDKPDYIRFLTKRGFVEGMRVEVSRLYLDSFDRGKFAPYETRCEDLGLTVATVAELPEIDPDWKHKLHEFQWEIFQDVPLDDPPTKQSYETWEKKLDSPTFLPEAWFLAIDDGRFVGLSSLWTCMGNKKKLWTGLTGVSRDYRRKGIATALKLRAIDYAAKRGIEFLETDNEEKNPMYTLNVKLGFRPIPAWKDFRKNLKEGEKDTSSASD